VVAERTDAHRGLLRESGEHASGADAELVVLWGDDRGGVRARRRSPAGRALFGGVTQRIALDFDEYVR
jgi:hypothetical protein